MANVDRVHLYHGGKIAATFPFQSTVPGGLYAGIASIRHNLEISNFFSELTFVKFSSLQRCCFSWRFSALMGNICRKRISAHGHRYYERRENEATRGSFSDAVSE